MSEYGVSEKELYGVWMQYLLLSASEKSVSKAIWHMRNNMAIRKETLDYFLSIGLEMFTKECLENV